MQRRTLPGTCLVAVCLAAAGPAAAAAKRVGSIAELEMAIAQAAPGDTITLANGSYTSMGIAVGCAGTDAGGESADIVSP
jgi:hypothetical protein